VQDTRLSCNGGRLGQRCDGLSAGRLKQGAGAQLYRSLQNLFCGFRHPSKRPIATAIIITVMGIEFLRVEDGHLEFGYCHSRCLWLGVDVDTRCNDLGLHDRRAHPEPLTLEDAVLCTAPNTCYFSNYSFVKGPMSCHNYLVILCISP